MRSKWFMTALNSLSLLFATYLVVQTVRAFTVGTGISGSEDDTRKLPQASLNRFVGKQMQDAIPEHDWSKTRRTVVLALRSTCPYCQKSVGFHRELNQVAQRMHYDVVVASDEPASTMKVALEAESLDISSVVDARFEMLGAVGTPTIFVVGQDGKIEGAWEGMLSAQREQDVAEALGGIRDLPATEQANVNISASNSLNVPYFPESRLNDLIARRDSTLYIVDVRSRPQFREAHISGALSIPQDELQTRIPHEIPQGAEVVVYCPSDPDCEGSYREQGAITKCTQAVFSVKAMGLRAQLLDQHMEDLSAHGVRAVSTK